MRPIVVRWLVVALVIAALADAVVRWKVYRARTDALAERQATIQEWVSYCFFAKRADAPNPDHLEYGLARLRELDPGNAPLLEDLERDLAQMKRAVAAHREVMTVLGEVESGLAAGRFVESASRLRSAASSPCHLRMEFSYWDEETTAVRRIREATKSLIKDVQRQRHLRPDEWDAVWDIEANTRGDHSRYEFDDFWLLDSRPFDSPEFLENLRGTSLPEIDIRSLSAPGVVVSNGEDGVVLENTGDDTARIILRKEVSWSDYLLRIQCTASKEGFEVEQRIADGFFKPVRHNVKAMMDDLGQIRPGVRSTIELLVNGRNYRASFGGATGLKGDCASVTARVGGCAILLPPHAKLALHKVEVQVFRYGPR